MKKLILVDEKDSFIGFEDKEKCHIGDGILHRAFSVFVFNDKKELLIQQRSKFKKLWPLYWSNTCCSHPSSRLEDYNKAAEKRLFEECGFSCRLKYLYKFQYKARYGRIGSENEICGVLIGKFNNGQKIAVNSKEVLDFKWINIYDLEKDIEKNSDKYTPWFKMEIKELMENHSDRIKELFT